MRSRLWKKRIEWEKDTIRKMIGLYCRKKHAGTIEICPDCRKLLDYADKRLSSCIYGDAKPTCEKCPVHCYKPAMREKVKMVMRYAGPRMIIYHPIDAIRHVL